jgi:hypothetical protein
MLTIAGAMTSRLAVYEGQIVVVQCTLQPIAYD